MTWIKGRVAVDAYFTHFWGKFKGEPFDSDLPPRKALETNLRVGYLKTLWRKHWLQE